MSSCRIITSWIQIHIPWKRGREIFFFWWSAWTILISCWLQLFLFLNQFNYFNIFNYRQTKHVIQSWCSLIIHRKSDYIFALRKCMNKSILFYVDFVIVYTLLANLLNTERTLWYIIYIIGFRHAVFITYANGNSIPIPDDNIINVVYSTLCNASIC